MERNFYLVVEMSFLEWKVLYEDLCKSLILCMVQPKVCWAPLHCWELHMLMHVFWLSRLKQREYLLYKNCINLAHGQKWEWERLVITILTWAQLVGAVKYTDCIFEEGFRPPHNECPRYDTKQSDGEASVMLGFGECGVLPSLPGPLWPGMGAPD